MSYHDPYVPLLVADGSELKSIDLSPEKLQASDCVVIVTDHSSIDYEQLRTHVLRVVDTRNALNRRRQT